MSTPELPVEAVQKLSLAPDELLIVKVPDNLPAHRSNQVMEAFAEAFRRMGWDPRHLMLSREGISLEVLALEQQPKTYSFDPNAEGMEQRGYSFTVEPQAEGLDADLIEKLFAYFQATKPEVLMYENDLRNAFIDGYLHGWSRTAVAPEVPAATAGGSPGDTDDGEGEG